MNVINKMLPYAILVIAAGFLIGMAAGDTLWGYIGLGLIIGSGVLTLGIVLIITCIHWQRNKASADKRLSEVSVILIFNTIMTLLLFVYLIWKHIVILNDGYNMFLLTWIGMNIGALRRLWVPNEDADKKKAAKEEEKEEAA